MVPGTQSLLVTQPKMQVSSDGAGGARGRIRQGDSGNLVCAPHLSSSAHREDTQAANKHSITDPKRNAR